MKLARTARALRIRRVRGFTLIEILAVVLMFALIAALVGPKLGFGGGHVRQEAQAFAAAIEFARQRAVMTGRTHELVIEVGRGEHWVEWAAPADPPAQEQARKPADGERKLQLVPPPLDIDKFVPVPSDEFGRAHTAPEDVAILGVELPGGFADDGRVELRIGPDGSADPAVIQLADPEGRNGLRVEVAPLADAVRITDAQP